MVDRRIVPDLRWIAQRYPIYVTDGYSGPLPNGEHVGCDNCHVSGSDHYNGLAVDLVPLTGEHANATPPGRRSPASPLWAEPVQNQPVPPFRWVGYDGDAGHGCGNHLHLSWNHAAVAAVPARRMGRSLPGRPGRRPKAAPANAQAPPEAAARPLRRHLHGPHRRRLAPAATEPA